MNRYSVRTGTISGLALLLLLATPLVHADTTIFTDPFFGSSGDDITRGFYLSSYPGTNLSTVTLAYTTNITGPYTTSLTARLGSYNGTIIGTTQTVTNTLTAFNETLVTYNFGGVSVPQGSVVTFTQALVSGPGFVDYDTGMGGTAGIFETEGTTPPLDVFRRASIGLIVTQTSAPAPPGTPLPSSLILMLTGLAGAGLLFVARKRMRPAGARTITL